MKNPRNIGGVAIEYNGSHPRGKFLFDVAMENQRAREKFPRGANLDTALMEEVGELAQALLKIKESGWSPEQVYKEAVQVASTAMRVAVEGCPEHDYRGVKCGFGGCKQPATGGPCALCYE